jgi:hypothetical protein
MSHVAMFHEPFTIPAGAIVQNAGIVGPEAEL